MEWRLRLSLATSIVGASWLLYMYWNNRQSQNPEEVPENLPHTEVPAVERAMEIALRAHHCRLSLEGGYVVYDRGPSRRK